MNETQLDKKSRMILTDDNYADLGKNICLLNRLSLTQKNFLLKDSTMFISLILSLSCIEDAEDNMFFDSLLSSLKCVKVFLKLSDSEEVMFDGLSSFLESLRDTAVWTFEERE